jgi:hypothetical protein
MKVTGPSNIDTGIQRDPSRDPSRHFAPVAPPKQPKSDRFEPSESVVEEIAAGDMDTSDEADEHRREQERRNPDKSNVTYRKGKGGKIETVNHDDNDGPGFSAIG